LRRRTIGIVTAAAVMGAIGIATVLATQGGADENHYSPNPETIEAEGRTLVENSVRVLRTVEDPAGLNWTVVTYLSSDGACFDAHVELVSSPDQGMLGGCGAPAGLGGYTVGGVELGGQWYTVGFGPVPLGTSEVTATLADGTTLKSDIVGGVWLSAVRGETDFTRIDARDAKGSVLQAVQPPSLTERLKAPPSPEGDEGRL
jgi:hypothetical protein